VKPFYDRLGYAEEIVFLGYTVPLLVLLGLRRFRKNFREVGIWYVAAAVFILLSLGPFLQVAGKTYKFIPLPSLVFVFLPVLESMRASIRFVGMSMFALSVLAGYCIASLRIRGPTLKSALISVFFFLILIEYFPPFPLQTFHAAKIHPFYLELRGTNEEFVVLEIPLTHWAQCRTQYFQTIHGKKLLSGHISRKSRDTWSFLREQVPIVNWLANVDSWDKRMPLENVEKQFRKELEILKDRNIRFVILHKDFWFWNWEAFDREKKPLLLRLLRTFAGAPYLEDEELLVFRL
jgi:hypothetical protein